MLDPAVMFISCVRLLETVVCFIHGMIVRHMDMVVSYFSLLSPVPVQNEPCLALN